MENQPQLGPIKESVAFYFLVSLFVILMITLTIFLVGCSSLHNHGYEDDKMIQFEKDGKLYPVHDPKDYFMEQPYY